MLEFGPDALGPGLDLLCIGTYSCALWAFPDHGWPTEVLISRAFMESRI